MNLLPPIGLANVRAYRFAQARLAYEIDTLVVNHDKHKLSLGCDAIGCLPIDTSTISYLPFYDTCCAVPGLVARHPSLHLRVRVLDANRLEFVRSVLTVHSSSLIAWSPSDARTINGNSVLFSVNSPRVGLRERLGRLAQGSVY